MKKIKYIFLSAIICIAAIALVFQSCNNENGVSSSDSSSKIVISSQYDHLDLPKEYQQIGQFHNEALDSVYAELEKTLSKTYKKAKVKGNFQQISSSLKSINLVEIAKKGFLNYCNSNKTLKDNFEICETTFDNQIKRQSIKGSAYHTKSLSNSSPILCAFMDSIHTAIKDECLNPNLSGLEKRLNKINNEASAKLSKEDTKIVYSATSVAYSSFQYWRKNILKWSSTSATYGVSNTHILSLCKKNKRFKVYGTAESDWNNATELPTLYVYPDPSFYYDYFVPLVNADCDAAADSAYGAVGHALYIAAGTAGVGTGAAIGTFVTEIAVGSGTGSAIYYIRFL